MDNKKPTREINAGARAERRAIRGIVNRWREYYEGTARDHGDGTAAQQEQLGLAFAMDQVLNDIDKHARATGKRAGGTGRK